MSNNKSGFGLIGLVIAVAVIGLLAGGGLYLREAQQTKSQLQVGLEAEKKAQELRDKILQQQKQQLEAVGEKPETRQPSPTDTSTWKTYRNEKYGFEVKYPGGWSVIENRQSNDVALFPPGSGPDPSQEYHGDIFISVYPNPNRFDVETFYKNVSDGDIYSIAESRIRMRVSSYEAVKLLQVPSHIPFDAVAIRRGDMIIQISDLNNNSFFDTMISTFKFIPLETR